MFHAGNDSLNHLEKGFDVRVAQRRVNRIMLHFNVFFSFWCSMFAHSIDFAAIPPGFHFLHSTRPAAILPIDFLHSARLDGHILCTYRFPSLSVPSSVRSALLRLTHGRCIRLSVQKYAQFLIKEIHRAIKLAIFACRGGDLFD